MWLIDQIRSLFGQGKIRFACITETGTPSTNTINYIGCPESYDEIRNLCYQTMLVEKGKRIREIRLIGMTGIEAIKLDDNWYELKGNVWRRKF